MWLSEKQKSYIHFLISLCIEKAARNRWTQHLIFWTKKSMKICWVLDHHHHKKNLSTYLQTFIKVSANHDPTFVESMMAMQSSSFFFWAKSIKRVCVVGREDKWLWKTTKTLTSCTSTWPYRTTANDLVFTFAMQCVLRKPTTLLHLGFDDGLTTMILMILCTSGGGGCKLYCSWTWMWS